VITELTDEAREFGRLAHRAVESAGGDTLVQRAEAEPHRRGELVDAVLAELGASDLDPTNDADELEAAAALCRTFGSWALPYPLAEVLCRPRDYGDGLIVVGDGSPAAALSGLEGRWIATTLDGRRAVATVHDRDIPPRKSAFVADLELDLLDDAGDPLDAARVLVLQTWTLLGMLDRALALAVGYVNDRQQFGQPLARFQGVQFQLTDAEVERIGAEEVAKYALWSIETARPAALVDALAARLLMIEAADVVFRITHQLHGAIGFCDETTLSWISRYSQPLRRLPFGLGGTRRELTDRSGRAGLDGLFDADGAAR
jgi:hypothetical protein